MISIFPKFYQEFQCKADKCQHSCCKGWEIDIDAETAANYLSMEGSLGAELRANIGENEDGYYFKLTSDERCPFLQADGLCKIILNTGEEKLCEICTMHPRFFTMSDDVELCGVGLSCEKTCELILAEEKELVFYLEDTGEEMIFAEIVKLLELDLPVAKQQFILNTVITEAEIDKLLTKMAKTEPIDEAWTEQVAWLKAQENKADRLIEYGKNCSRTIWARIYQYILYRQLERIADTPLEKIVNYAEEAVMFIMLETVLGKPLAESLRRWSEQIEYDTDNVDLLLS